MGSTPPSYGTLMTGTSIDPLSSSVSSVVGSGGGWSGPPACPQRPGFCSVPARPLPHRPLSPASTEAQRLLWQSMEGHRLSRRGLDAGRDPLAAIPLEALVGRAPAPEAMQPGPRRNTRYRNKRQRGEWGHPGLRKSGGMLGCSVQPLALGGGGWGEGKPPSSCLYLRSPGEAVDRDRPGVAGWAPV